MGRALDRGELRARLGDARLLLVFSPELCGERDALAVLDAVLDHVDLVQVRPKPSACEVRDAIAGDPPCEARATWEWARRALDLSWARPDPPLVTVNDRVDVALALRDAGCAGVHLGQDDLLAEDARALLGEDPLIGLSTHDVTQVALAGDTSVDYLGFGPAFPTATKGYARGRGVETCWVASQASAVPVFPIGGITRERAAELAEVGRAAVGSAILSADDPARAARELRALLAE